MKLYEYWKSCIISVLAVSSFTPFLVQVLLNWDSQKKIPKKNYSLPILAISAQKNMLNIADWAENKPLHSCEYKCLNFRKM